MQYAKMIDLIEKAKQAGGSETTAWIIDMLLDSFHDWANVQEIGELTDEEHDAMFNAFCEGFGNK